MIVSLKSDVITNKNKLLRGKHVLEFGDVIYRPCLSYAGKKKFVNTQIILDVIIKNNEVYIRSVDFIGQKWTDSIHDLGDKIFVDKNKARKKLNYMIAEKERKAQKEYFKR